MKTQLRKNLGLILNCSILLFACRAQAQAVSEDWARFQNDPRAFMNSHPAKFDAEGKIIPDGMDSPFSRQDILSGDFKGKKIRFRAENMNLPATESPRWNRWSEEADSRMKLMSFFDLDEFTAKGIRPLFKLEELEAKGLRSAQLAETPWSDTYWPIYQGIIGARYASQKFFSTSSDWTTFYGMIQGDNSLSAIVKRGNPIEIDSLSPAEKYDLLIGDPRNRATGGFLTPRMWAEGKRYKDTYGSVETWMGICHGWAPASFMLPRPRTKVVAANAVNAGQLNFYPSDVKGLASYLWAEAPFDVRYLGERCNSKDAETDPETGRLVDPDCFDVNPGIWHLVVANQIGQAKRGFVIDAAYDYEVWNQPVSAYSYKYFNPQTGAPSESLADASVERADFTKDRFANFRSANAVRFVGVEMSLTYVAESLPSHQETDSPEMDVTRTVRYVYDLELNKDGEVIGGEWYLNQHPDFLWLPRADAQALSDGDSRISSSDTWSPEQPLPPFWRGIALATAARSGQPLAAIVNRLAHH